MLSRLKIIKYPIFLFFLLASAASRPISPILAFLGTGATGTAAGLSAVYALRGKGNWRALGVPVFGIGLMLGQDYFYSRTPGNKIKKAKALLKKVKESNAHPESLYHNNTLQNAIRLLNEACTEDDTLNNCVTTTLKQINTVSATLKIKVAEQLFKNIVNDYSVLLESPYEENCEKKIVDNAKAVYCLDRWPLVVAVQSLTLRMTVLRNAETLLDEACVENSEVNNSVTAQKEQINTVYASLLAIRKIIVLSTDYPAQLEQYEKDQQRKNQTELEEKKFRQQKENIEKAIQKGIKEGLKAARQAAGLGLSLRPSTAIPRVDYP